MSLRDLRAALLDPDVQVVSTDIFDTVLLRGLHSHTYRLFETATRAAQMIGVDPETIARLRWSANDAAHRATMASNPMGDASVGAIWNVVAHALGADATTADLLRQIEVEVEIRHLHPNTRLLTELSSAAATGTGTRVIALSDTYFSAEDIRVMLDKVAAPHPISTVYTSCDLGFTKHAGGAFAAVSELERTPGANIVHVGDNAHADVLQARSAGWRAALLPRSPLYGAQRFMGAPIDLPAILRRVR